MQIGCSQSQVNPATHSASNTSTDTSSIFYLSNKQANYHKRVHQIYNRIHSNGNSNSNNSNSNRLKGSHVNNQKWVELLEKYIASGSSGNGSSSGCGSANNTAPYTYSVPSNVLPRHPMVGLVGFGGNCGSDAVPYSGTKAYDLHLLSQTNASASNSSTNTQQLIKYGSNTLHSCYSNLLMSRNTTDNTTNNANGSTIMSVVGKVAQSLSFQEGGE